jgi:hypothetical protein
LNKYLRWFIAIAILYVIIAGLSYYGYITNIGSESFQQILTLAYIKYEFYYYVNYIAYYIASFFPPGYQGNVITATKDLLYAIVLVIFLSGLYAKFMRKK